MIARIYVWLWLGMIVFGSPPLNAQELGRLFFNAAERKAMNEKRLPPKLRLVESIPKEIKALEVKASAEVSDFVRLPNPKITGKVIRSSGNNTVWVNRHPQYERAKNQGSAD